MEISLESAALLDGSKPSFSVGYRRFFLGLLMVVYVCNFLDRTLMSILLEPIKDEFGLSDLQVGLLGGLAFSIFYTTMSIPISRLADRLSRVKILALCVLCWSGLTALTSVGESFITLFALRLGVGLAEAGANPCSHSLIADLFPLTSRSGAMAVYSAGIPVGVLLGNLGGILGDLWGWRTAFVVLGLPGVALAGMVATLLKDPPRGGTQQAKDSQGLDEAKGVAYAPRPFVESVRFLVGQRAFLHQSFAGGLVSMNGYAATTFVPAFWSRVHGLSLTERSALQAGLSVFGLVGTIVGGQWVDWWSKRRNGDIRPSGWAPALAMCAGFPFALIGLQVSSWPVAAAMFAVANVADGIWRGPCFALGQSLSPVHSRALSCSLMLFVVNILGLAMGPTLVGAISSALEAKHGEAEAVRLALSVSSVFIVWAAFHFYMSTRTLRADYERAQQVDRESLPTKAGSSQ